MKHTLHSSYTPLYTPPTHNSLNLMSPYSHLHSCIHLYNTQPPGRPTLTTITSTHEKIITIATQNVGGIKLESGNSRSNMD
jgi:hypothetical protein